MAQAIDPAHLELILKTMGIENVKEVVTAYEDLAKSAKDTVKPLEEAETALKELSKTEEQVAEENRKFIQTEQKLQEEIARAIEQIDRQVKSLGDTRELVESLNEPLQRTAGQGEGEDAVGGFKGMAGGAIKAEKAINSLMSGKGLGRLGPMLESLLGPLGVPGLGLAFGAIAMEAEPAIRAVAGFIDAWDKGIKPLSDAAEAIERLTRVQGDERRQRAYQKIEARIAPLEEKREAKGFLSAEETLQLRRLHEAAARYEDEASQEAAAADRRKRQQTAKKESADIDLQFDKYLRDQRTAAQKESADIDDQLDKAQVDKRRQHDKEIVAEQKHAAAEAKRERKHEESEQKRLARESTPLAIQHREQQAVQQEAAGYAQMALPGMPVGVQERAAHHMVENYNMGLAIGHTVDEQVYYAIMQTRQDLARGIINGMKRNQSYTEIFQGDR